VKAIERAARHTSAVFAAIAAACLVFMMIVTFCDVVGRYVFNSPIYFTIEATELAMGIIIFLGLARTTLRRGHITVDVLVGTFPPPMRRLADFIANLCILGVVALLTWLLVDRAMTNISDDLRTQVLYMPVFPFAFIMALGAGATTLIALWNMASTASGADS
jgi:TRAP-type C4-dicarboxylate transport system permease small subunit